MSDVATNSLPLGKALPISAKRIDFDITTPETPIVFDLLPGTQAVEFRCDVQEAFDDPAAKMEFWTELNAAPGAVMWSAPLTALPGTRLLNYDPAKPGNACKGFFQLTRAAATKGHAVFQVGFLPLTAYVLTGPNNLP